MLLPGLYALLFNVLPKVILNKCLNGAKKILFHFNRDWEKKKSRDVSEKNCHYIKVIQFHLSELKHVSLLRQNKKEY
jgi:hypothetical protein